MDDVEQELRYAFADQELQELKDMNSSAIALSKIMKVIESEKTPAGY